MTAWADAAAEGRRPVLDWLRCQFEIRRGGDASNLGAMEGLRGLAVILVFCVHFADQVFALPAAAAMDRQVLEAMAKIGHAGVDLFFVLSGYLIYGSLIGRETAFWPYFRRRVRRIYPTFLAVFALYLVLNWAMPGRSKLPAEPTQAAWYLLQNLLLLPGMLPIEPFIAVAWSLSYEMFFYIVAPLVIGLAGLRQRGSAARAQGLVVLALLIVGICAAVGGPVRLAMFLVGAALFEWAAVQRRAAGWPLVAALALAAAFAITALRPDGSVGYAWRTASLGVAFFLLCAASFGTARRTAATAVFDATPLRWLGNMSYSYYLIHGLALQAFFLVVRRLVPDVGTDAGTLAVLWLVSFLVSLVPSALLYIAIERPLSLVSARTPRAA